MLICLHGKFLIVLSLDSHLGREHYVSHEYEDSLREVEHGKQIMER